MGGVANIAERRGSPLPLGAKLLEEKAKLRFI